MPGVRPVSIPPSSGAACRKVESIDRGTEIPDSTEGAAAGLE